MTYPPQPPPQDPNQPPVVSGPPYQQSVYPQQQPYGYQPGYPQQPHAYQPPPPAKPVNSKIVFWTSSQGVVCAILIAFGVFVLVAAVGNAVSGPASANFDVTVTSCDGGESTATIGFTVKNTGKKTADATVKVEYRDGSGNRLDTDTAYVRDIAPGDTVRGEESTILDASPGNSIRCEIVSVS